MRRVGCLVAVLVAALAFTSGAATADKSKLEMYTATVDRATVAKLAREGVDIAATKQVAGGVRVDLVLSARGRDRLAAQGVRLALKRNKDGLTVQEQAAKQAANGFTVWRSWDERGGIRDELYEIARKNPTLVKLEVIGHSRQGREIIALKVTRNAKQLADGARPDVFYMATIHAREWISTEVNRRLLHHFVDNYGKNAEVTNLVNTRELWFVLVANPDGYQHTFDAERLWRKNLRDNNGDGQTTVGDGVDLNRNYDEKWNYDNEGSSSEFASDTYRGPSSGVRARDGGDPGPPEATRLSLHGHVPLLRSAPALHVGLPGADADGGRPDLRRAIRNGCEAGDRGIRPGRRCRPLHHQRHDGRLRPCGDGHARLDARARARAAKAVASSSPTTKRSSRPSSRRTCRSRSTSPRPRRTRRSRSHTSATRQSPSISTCRRSIPRRRNNPLSDFRFSVSYGDPQPVQVLARRSLGAVTLKYQINGGAVQSGSTTEWNGGERFGDDGDVYYRIMRGSVTGTSPGDTVKVWFEASGGTVKSDSFTYTAKVESSNRVLVLSAEDYTGISPVYKKTNGPSYLSYYLDALAANGISADVYDVDANGRKAPSHLGVLSHYDAVIWYTGDDVLMRDARHGGRHRLPPRERRDARRPGVPQRGRPPAQDRQVRRPRRGGRLRVQPRDERALQPGR